jgi:phosphate-selective porin OprO and OprP
MRSFFAFFMVVLSFSLVYSQEIKKDSIPTNDLRLAALPYYSYGKGLGITSPDSLFQLNIRFRMQNRVTYFENEGEDAAYSGEIRRLRLRFDGYVGNPMFSYVIQLSFAPGDVGEIEEGENM